VSPALCTLHAGTCLWPAARETCNKGAGDDAAVSDPKTGVPLGLPPNPEFVVLARSRPCVLVSGPAASHPCHCTVSQQTRGYGPRAPGPCFVGLWVVLQWYRRSQPRGRCSNLERPAEGRCRRRSRALCSNAGPIRLNSACPDPYRSQESFSSWPCLGLCCMAAAIQLLRRGILPAVPVAQQQLHGPPPLQILMPPSGA
jgi:hypothetical protein